MRQHSAYPDINALQPRPTKSRATSKRTCASRFVRRQHRSLLLLRLAPRAQEGRDEVLAHEQYEGRGAAHRDGAEAAATRQASLPSPSWQQRMCQPPGTSRVGADALTRRSKMAGGKTRPVEIHTEPRDRGHTGFATRPSGARRYGRCAARIRSRRVRAARRMRPVLWSTRERHHRFHPRAPERHDACQCAS